MRRRAGWAGADPPPGGVRRLPCARRVEILPAVFDGALPNQYPRAVHAPEVFVFDNAQEESYTGVENMQKTGKVDIAVQTRVSGVWVVWVARAPGVAPCVCRVEICLAVFDEGHVIEWKGPVHAPEVFVYENAQGETYGGVENGQKGQKNGGNGHVHRVAVRGGAAAYRVCGSLCAPWRDSPWGLRQGSSHWV